MINQFTSLTAALQIDLNHNHLRDKVQDFFYVQSIISNGTVASRIMVMLWGNRSAASHKDIR